MNSSDARSHHRRHLICGAVSGSGTLLAVLHLVHALSENTPFAFLIGGVFPFVIALAVAVGGYLIWNSDFPDFVILRIGGWVGLGMGLLGLFGSGAIVFEYTEGVRLLEEGYLILTFITFGAATGLLLGWYDARRQVLTAHLKNKQRELEEQNERLEGFAHVISHDLRNPLNVATGRLEFIDANEHSEHIKAISRAHDRMDNLIEDVLTLARQGQTVGATEPVSLEQIASQAWTHVTTEDASLEIETDMKVEADASRLQQLFENLFRNAIEHGGDNVTVHVGALDDTTGFYITDDGPGIPAGEREQIFEYGYSTASDGTGLGLGIVQQIVQAHGWTITATQAVDGGAKFEIRDVQHTTVDQEWETSTSEGVSATID